MPSFHNNRDGNLRDAALMDEISTDSVIKSFHKMSVNGEDPVAAARLINRDGNNNTVEFVD